MHSALRRGTEALKVAKSRLAWPWEGSWLGSIRVYHGYLAIGAGLLRACVIPNKRNELAETKFTANLRFRINLPLHGIF